MSAAELKVPRGLSAEARKLWIDINKEFEVDSATARHLLLMACHSLDRLRDAQKDIKKYGITTSGRYGQRIQNPAINVEKSARGALMAALKQIGYSGGVE